MLFQRGQDMVDRQRQMSASASFLARLFNKLPDDADDAIDRNPGATWSCLVLAQALLRHAHDAAGGPAAQFLKRGGLASWQEQRVSKYIDSHIGEPIKVAELAEVSGLSVRHFSVACRQSFGLAPHAFLLYCRIELAMMLMSSANRTFADVALACGFCDQAHFCRRFRRVVGASAHHAVPLNDRVQKAQG